MGAIRELLVKSSSSEDAWKSTWAEFESQCKSFDEFLKQNVLPHSKNAGPLPRDIYEFLLASKSVDWSVERLIREGKEDFKKTQKVFTELAEKLAPVLGIKEKSPLAVLTALKAKQVIRPDEVLAAYRDAEQWALEKLSKSPKISLPSESISFRLMDENQSRDEPYAHLVPPPLAFNDGQSPELLLPALKSGAFPLDDFNFQAAIKVILVHEGRPGHDAFFRKLLDQGVSIIRARYGYTIANVEGWAFYAEELMNSVLPLESQFVAAQMRLWRDARMFIDPELNLGKMKADEAKRILTQEVGLSAELAKQEVDRSMVSDPGQAAAYGYGFFKVMEAREQLKKKMGRNWNEVCFNDGVLTLGLTPVRWLADELKRSLRCPKPAPQWGEFARRVCVSISG